MLANVGLERLITRSVDEYVDTAVALAHDLETLTQWRDAAARPNGRLGPAGFRRLHPPPRNRLPPHVAPLAPPRKHTLSEPRATACYRRAIEKPPSAVTIGGERPPDRTSPARSASVPGPG